MLSGHDHLADKWWGRVVVPGLPDLKVHGFNG